MNFSTKLATSFLTLSYLAVLSVTSASAQTTRVRPEVRPEQKLGFSSTYIFYGNDGFGRGRVANSQTLIVPGSNFGERLDFVEYGSPAYRAGLERGDIIVGFVRDNQTYHIRSPYTLDHVIQSSGRYLRFKVRNVRNGQLTYVTVDSYFGGGGYDGGGGGGCHRNDGRGR